MASTESKLEFRCQWLGWDRKPIGSIIIRKHDLTDAIAAAADLMHRGRLGSASAHGFFVERKR